MTLRLVFMGTPAFALPTLDRLLAAGHDIVAAYTQPPRRAGRGQRLRLTPVHEAAVARNIEVRAPASLKGADEQAAFKALAADAAVVVAYGLLLPPAVLEAPRLGCFNLHPSLLPRWRGAAPVERAVEAGDSETGVCIMRLNRGLDTGPVVSSERQSIGPRDTAADLAARLAERGADLMVEALAGIEAGTLTPKPQSTKGITYAAKIAPEECRVIWSRSAAAIDRQIRAFNPSPGVWCRHGGERIKILAAVPVDMTGAPGAVLDGEATIACGEGALRLEVVQRQDRAPQPVAAFLRGYPLLPGASLD
jgi:methionyl-tRNA formyltransferase